VIVLGFTARGIPVPQGSMRAFVRAGHAVVTSDNPLLRSWRRDVTEAAAEAFAGRPPLAGPVKVALAFTLPRPAGHFGKRGLLPSAPRLPIGARGDLDKLCRAILDAITGAGLWRDDGQVVELGAVKCYGDQPGVHVKIVDLAELGEALWP
jgi:Holliday junction resolvase RusA-like endonuclease